MNGLIDLWITLKHMQSLDFGSHGVLGLKTTIRGTWIIVCTRSGMDSSYEFKSVVNYCTCIYIIVVFLPRKTTAMREKHHMWERKCLKILKSQKVSAILFSQYFSNTSIFRLLNSQISQYLRTGSFRPGHQEQCLTRWVVLAKRVWEPVRGLP